ncbi:MAG: DNA polymerase III subunit delta [Actinomycetota bacterium]
MIKLIWSSDELLATEAAADAVASAAGDAEVLTLDAEGGLEGLEEALFAGSLFAARRTVLIRNAEALAKSAVEQLGAALHREGLPDAVVVVAVSERVPNQLVGAVDGVADVTKLARPRRGELANWVTKRMKAAGLQPGRDAATTLVEAVGEGLRDLAQAIDQIAVRAGRGGKVERENILEHFALSGEQPIWVLFDAMIRHEGPKAFETLRRLLAHGDEPLPVLGAIVSQVRGVMRAKSLLERGALRDGDLARSLAVSEGRAAVLRKQTARLSWEWLVGVHRLCADADVELKGGDDGGGAVLPAEIVLERLVAGALDA